MKVLVLADIDDLHWQHGTGEADLILALGDVADCVIQEAADAHGNPPVFAVKGNHDSHALFPEGITDLHLHTVSFGGLTWGGFSGAWKYKPRGHHLFEQQEATNLLKDFPHVDVFVSHNSPLGIHDKPDDIHTGFAALNDYVERQQPRLLIHGHQHINLETTVGKTRIVGVYGHRILNI